MRIYQWDSRFEWDFYLSIGFHCPKQWGKHLIPTILGIPALSSLSLFIHETQSVVPGILVMAR